MSKHTSEPVCTCAVIEYGEEIDFCPLHAAAPDLLEACEALLHLYETPGDMTNYEALAIQRDAIAAIAKAKGKED